MKIKFFLILLISSSHLFAQSYSDYNSKNKTDTTEYPYALPILGSKVHALGFDLPKPAGIGVNYIYQKSNILISDVKVGFNGSEMVDVDELINFNSTQSQTNAINIRPDMWLFPFLNIYGIFAKANSTTSIDVSVGIPSIDNGFNEIINIQSDIEVPTQTLGFGLIPAASFFGGWIALDMNFSWTDVETLDNRVFSFVFDPRIGKTFKFKKPDRKISVWVGAFRLQINRQTKGSIAFEEVMDADKWYGKIEVGEQKVGEAQIELDDWWASLNPIEQQNPINIAKREANQKKLNVASTVLVAAESAVGRVESSTVYYDINKRPASMWNYTFGSEFQLNKSWMFRAEIGGLTNRKHVLGSLQYRFGIGKKK